MTGSRPLIILQVEDSPADAALTAYAMQIGDIPYSMNVVNDGSKAIAFLEQVEPYKEAPRPDLILLDLDLPKMNGNEVLEFIKADESLMTIPVIIFSTHESPESKKHAYELHCNSYVVKPMDLDTFRERVQEIAQYWCNTSQISLTAKT
jgi:CheY-like chemotaxis protein